jgi:hypothetical protein
MIIMNPDADLLSRNRNRNLKVDLCRHQIQREDCSVLKVLLSLQRHQLDKTPLGTIQSTIERWSDAGARYFPSELAYSL